MSADRCRHGQERRSCLGAACRIEWFASEAERLTRELARAQRAALTNAKERDDLLAELEVVAQDSSIVRAELTAAKRAATIRGFHFRQGPEVTRPIPFDWTMSWPKVDEARHAWARAIDEAARYEDAWGLLCTRPDGDVTLRDCLTPGATWEATSASAVHLLIAREAR